MNERTAPAESARTRIGCTTASGSSPGWCPRCCSAGSWAMAIATTANWSAPEFAAAFPARNTPASASPLASRKQNIGWNPNPRLKCGVAPCLRSEWISTSDASTSSTTCSGVAPAAHAVARACGTRGSQPVEHGVVDLVEGPPDRRRRGDLAEHVGLITQRRHVRHTAPTGSEHHRHLSEQPTAIVTEGALPSPRDRRRIGRCRDRPDQPVPPTDGCRRATPSDGHRRSPPAVQPCVYVHLASALPVRSSVVSTTPESLTARALPRIRDPQPTPNS